MTKKIRTQQVRGPNPPRRLTRGAGAPDESTLGSPLLGLWEEHLEKFHRFADDDEDDTNFRFTRALVVAARKWRKISSDRIKPLGYSMVQWETLYLIACSPSDLAQSELARFVGVEGPTMVRILHMLSEEGLVERHQSSEDLRVTVNRITEQGRKVVAEIMSVTNDLRQDILADVDPDDLERALAVLNRVLANLEVFPKDSSGPASGE